MKDNDMDPNAAAELRMLRAEIAALREHVTAPAAAWTRRAWLPELHQGHVELPVRHYQLLKRLRQVIRHRARTPLPPTHANRQRRNSLILLLTTLVRVVAWTILIACVGAGIGHVAGFHWAQALAASIPFVALISLYANWATDLGAAIAAYAALVASDVHSQVTASSGVLAADLAELQEDVDRLAQLQGEEAVALAAVVKFRLAREAGVH